MRQSYSMFLERRNDVVSALGKAADYKFGTTWDGHGPIRNLKPRVEKVTRRALERVANELWITARKRDLSSSGNGYETNRQIYTPDGEFHWASDYSARAPVDGRWSRIGPRKEDREREQMVLVPGKTVILQFRTEYSRFQKQGVTVKAAVVRPGYDLDFTLPVRRDSGNYVVTMPDNSDLLFVAGGS